MACNVTDERRKTLEQAGSDEKPLTPNTERERTATSLRVGFKGGQEVLPLEVQHGFCTDRRPLELLSVYTVPGVA